ncbi:hypothetical protein SELMODRAFT_402005 [Selaginella moellendorffii]|uniref:Uncharacterized protein n=1 Tax=Selaginella moellendorffii TaxID=88036 RepID=D8QPA1_SELML|nr:hypothetical protein SELMODRAFT_402005 [Selaginella moellendorffii]
MGAKPRLGKSAISYAVDGYGGSALTQRMPPMGAKPTDLGSRQSPMQSLGCCKGLEEQIDDLPELPNELDENVTLVEDVNAKQPEAGLDTMQAFQFSGTQAHDGVILIDKEQRPEDLRSVPRRKQTKEADVYSNPASLHFETSTGLLARILVRGFGDPPDVPVCRLLPNEVVRRVNKADLHKLMSSGERDNSRCEEAEALHEEFEAELRLEKKKELQALSKLYREDTINKKTWVLVRNYDKDNNTAPSVGDQNVLCLEGQSSRQSSLAPIIYAKIMFRKLLSIIDPELGDDWYKAVTSIHKWVGLEKLYAMSESKLTKEKRMWYFNKLYILDRKPQQQLLGLSRLQDALWLKWFVIDQYLQIIREEAATIMDEFKIDDHKLGEKGNFLKWYDEMRVLIELKNQWKRCFRRKTIIRNHRCGVICTSNSLCSNAHYLFWIDFPNRVVPSWEAKLFKNHSADRRTVLWRLEEVHKSMKGISRKKAQGSQVAVAGSGGGPGLGPATIVFPADTARLSRPIPVMQLSDVVAPIWLDIKDDLVLFTPIKSIVQGSSTGYMMLFVSLDIVPSVSKVARVVKLDMTGVYKVYRPKGWGYRDGINTRISYHAEFLVFNEIGTGTGTTLLAALDSGRHVIGMEKNEELTDFAKQRIASSGASQEMGEQLQIPQLVPV